MKKISLLLLVVLFCLESINAQPYYPFDIDSRHDREDGSFVIYANKKDLKVYTLVFTFSDLQNVAGTSQDIVILRNDGDLFRFKPLTEGEATSVSFEYLYYSAWINPNKVKENFIYRLPFAENNKRKVTKIANIQDDLGLKSNAHNWTAFQFVLEEGENVYAIRKGVVSEIRLGNNKVVKGSSYVSQNNELTVQHEDGTVANYGYLDSNSIKVKEGDIVYPNTIIAKAAKVDGINFEVRLSIYYATCKNLYESAPKIEYVYIDPVFATSDGPSKLSSGKEYSAVMSEKILTEEMSKREIKNMKNTK